MFLVILLTEFLLAHGAMGAWELVGELLREGLLGAALGLGGGALLVAVLNRVAMPGGLHPLFVVTGAITIAGFTLVVGGSGLLAVYVAGLVMANRPTRAYPSIVGFHDAVTWLCQIVMFLVLGLLVTPVDALDLRAARACSSRVVLTLVARPLAVWLCLGPFGFTRNEKALRLLGRPARRGLDLPRGDPAARRAARRRRSTSTSPSSSCSSRCWCRARR